MNANTNNEENANRRPELSTLSTRLLAFGLAILVGAALFILLFLIDNNRDVIDELEKKTYDVRVALKLGSDPSHKPSSDIIIIKFDDPTLTSLEDEFGVWPWPRSVHADMIAFLNQAGARAIAYDIMFVAKKKGLEESDKALIDAFKNYPNVYLSMNFDNNKFVTEILQKGTTMRDIEKVSPLALNLKSELKDPNPYGVRMKHGFFDNDAMTFNGFRRIMPEFFEVKDRIAFINHGRDKDGVSRSNPLFFRFIYTEPFISPNKPYQEIQPDIWVDSKGARVSRDGALLDAQGRVTGTPKTKFFPYLGLKLAMDLAGEKGKHPEMVVTEDAHLQFANYDVPLLKRGSTAGSLLVNWYNEDVEYEYTKMALAQLKRRYDEIQVKLKTASAASFNTLQQASQDLEPIIQQLEANLRDGEPHPYKEVPAWKIINLMKHYNAGKLTPEDKGEMVFLKNKIIFIGTTAVSTYDIKTTPIHKLLPGVVLQATIFDNLYQNHDYMHRADDSVNLGLTALLCLMTIWVILRMHSAVSGLVTTLTLVALYVMGTVFCLKYNYTWLNIAMPLISVSIVTIVTFMAKYMNRDLDYKKTYKLATTDGLTGLYNHRYFQEQLATALDTASKTNGTLSLILVDIDFFKKFNDTYGHQAGDEVLRHVAKKLRTSVRSNDLVARYGGEEMAIILDKASENESLEVARKLCRLVAEEEYPIAEGVAKHVTVSIGVSTYPAHGRTTTDLIEFADRGLYRAKENGRNQVGAQFDNDSEASSSKAPVN